MAEKEKADLCAKIVQLNVEHDLLKKYWTVGLSKKSKLSQ
ncbi:MAG: hypothetical protein ACJAZX_000821 [Rickettsiales bacterium]